MIATDARTWSMPLLVGGMVIGVVLAVLTTRPGGGALTALATALPFLLAALTGVAKTTTP
jgi:hypothetical protein